MDLGLLYLLSKEERMTRKEELKEIFKDVDDNEKQLIDPLLEEVIFLEEQMKHLRQMPFISVHPSNPALQRKTEAAKLYKECSQSYMNAIRILVGVLNKVESSAQDELLRKLSEFA